MGRDAYVKCSHRKGESKGRQKRRRGEISLRKGEEQKGKMEVEWEGG